MGSAHPGAHGIREWGEGETGERGGQGRVRGTTGHGAVKGLYNRVGLNNCFLNVVIQSLWHIDHFRERFISLDYTHVHRATPCLFCALRSVFVDYEFSEGDVIPPRLLRAALAELYEGEHRFQWGAMSDAEEVLEAILEWLHADQVGASRHQDHDDASATPCSPPCISHRVFASETCDIRVCSACGAHGEPAPRESLLYRVYVADMTRLGRTLGPVGLAALLKAEYDESPQRLPCPAGCRGTASVRR